MNNVKGFTNTRKINQEAAQWILLIEDNPKLSSAQAKALEEWVATSEIHKKCLQRMAHSWDNMDVLRTIMAPEDNGAQAAKESMMAWLVMPFIALAGVAKRNTGFTTMAPVSQKRLLLALPVLMLCVFMFSLNYTTSIEEAPLSNQLVTQIGEQSQHTLADGSIVWLNSNSEVMVDYSQNLRQIYLLKGEAHFEVAKDKNRPFEVHADNRLVRAIGTAFSVHRLAHKIDVMVSEGTIELAIVEGLSSSDDSVFDASRLKTTANPSTKTVSTVLKKLEAGHEISMLKTNNIQHASILQDAIEIDRYDIIRKLAWREGKLVFAGESLEHVITEISRHTDIQIEVLDPTLQQMRIGGQFKIGETESLFAVLDSGFGVSVNKLSNKHVQLSMKSSVN